MGSTVTAQVLKFTDRFFGGKDGKASRKPVFDVEGDWSVNILRKGVVAGGGKDRFAAFYDTSADFEPAIRRRRKMAAVPTGFQLGRTDEALSAADGVLNGHEPTRGTFCGFREADGFTPVLCEGGYAGEQGSRNVTQHGFSVGMESCRRRRASTSCKYPRWAVKKTFIILICKS